MGSIRAAMTTIDRREMSDIKLYESALFTDITGPAIRPGGLRITKAGIEACHFNSGASLLDIGCGRGASVEFLGREYSFDCAGVDISETLIREGLERDAALKLIQSDAHELPFADSCMDGVLIECSFSLMADKQQVLGEIRRVLKNGGYLIISDIYIREGSLEAAGDAPGEACFFHALELTSLDAWLKKYGFTTALLEDHTRELKELMANIILKHGSMQRFWEQVWGHSVSCETVCRVGRDVKLGYFLTVARLTKPEEVACQ